MFKTPKDYERAIARLEQELLAPSAPDDKENAEDEGDLELWTVPPHCIPIRADVRTFDFAALAQAQKQLTGRLFDVIVTDPPSVFGFCKAEMC